MAEEPEPKGKDGRPDWDLTGISCVSSLGNNGFTYSGTAATIDAQVGDEVTCTFTNTKRGSIIIVKDAMPNDPQDFDFTITGGDFSTAFILDDDGDDTDNPRRTSCPAARPSRACSPGPTQLYRLRWRDGIREK